MSSKQKFIIIGNLGRDPELKYMPDGTAVVNFSVAVNQYVKGENHTLWVGVSTFGKRAENCNQYLRKGSKVYCEGVLRFDNETGTPRVFTRKDGSAGSSFEMQAYDVTFLSGMSDSAGESGSYADPVAAGSSADSDEIPF